MARLSDLVGPREPAAEFPAGCEVGVGRTPAAARTSLTDLVGPRPELPPESRGEKNRPALDDLTHINGQGRARMVDVSAKEKTHRTARAAAFVHMAPATLELVRTGGLKKGDVLAVAQVAGIMAAKRTWELVPMCHPIALTGVDIAFELQECPDRCGVAIQTKAKCCGETGVEMEALTAASVAALTVYDMCKAVQRDMVIDQVRLLEKTGGKSGHFVREDQTPEEAL